MKAKAKSDSPPRRFESTREKVPTRYEKPIMGIKTSKNFVTANAVEAILMVPKQTGTGDLNYTKKEDFGKVPAYLTQVKEEIRRENEMIERYRRVHFKMGLRIEINLFIHQVHKGTDGRSSKAS